MNGLLVYADIEHEFGQRTDGYYVFTDQDKADSYLKTIDNSGAPGQYWSQVKLGWLPCGPKTETHTNAKGAIWVTDYRE